MLSNHETLIIWGLQGWLAANGLLFVAVSFALFRIERVLRKLDGKEVGLYCSGCSTALKDEPVRALAFADCTYLVYKCPICKTETLKARHHE